MQLTSDLPTEEGSYIVNSWTDFDRVMSPVPHGGNSSVAVVKMASRLGVTWQQWRSCCHLCRGCSDNGNMLSMVVWSCKVVQSVSSY